jgi:hypothetical protein
VTGTATAGTTNSGPVIGGVYVLSASGMMSWNAVDADGVAGATLTVDGTNVSQVNGPYAAASGVNFSGLFGTLAAGNHTYVITATDKLGNASTSSGQFTVAASSAAKSLARSAVMQSVAAGPASSAKLDWLYDVASPLSGGDGNTSGDATDAVLAAY